MISLWEKFYIFQYLYTNSQTNIAIEKKRKSKLNSKIHKYLDIKEMKKRERNRKKI